MECIKTENDKEVRYSYTKDSKKLFDVVYDKTFDANSIFQPERSKREDNQFCTATILDAYNG